MSQLQAKWGFQKEKFKSERENITLFPSSYSLAYFIAAVYWARRKLDALRKKKQPLKRYFSGAWFTIRHFSFMSLFETGFPIHLLAAASNIDLQPVGNGLGKIDVLGNIGQKYVPCCCQFSCSVLSGPLITIGNFNEMILNGFLW
ncbi:hypothetical protein CEXT_519701 [Caerostris extrusa]|uniref:Uncharacterized protein n=1 Tax=Caerostris extrusa TaxID=172846 RepID=A0AAV4R8M4_CAEEX|nr:hypothetical protein CEXT_519701 [Caerostris extrusa]